MTQHPLRVHHRTCHLCEAMCGLALAIDAAGRVVRVHGDAEDPLSRGHLCPKPVAIPDLDSDPDRLRRPVRRMPDGHFEEVGWNEALEFAATGLSRVQREHGRDAVAAYLGNPTVHNYGAMLFAPILLRSLGTKNRFSATSVDQLPHMLASLLMFGHDLAIPVPDVDRTQFMLVFGANPVVSNGSLMSAPGIRHRLEALRARGGRLVVLDPRRTETAKIADEHHFVKPGTDALVLLAMLHVLFAENLVRPGRLAAFTDGFEAVGSLAARFPPERIEAATGVAADSVRRIARDFAAASAAVAYGRVGVSTQEFGGLCAWLVNVLNVVTGNLDREGGSMFTRPAVDVVGITARRGRTGRYASRRSRLRGLPSFGGEFPCAVLAEEIATPGEGQIRGLLTYAGNPVLSTPGGVALDEALADLDFMVAIDYYVNETTRHADVILPPAGPLERDHYDLAFHILAIRNTAKYSVPLRKPAPGSLQDWEILHALARRLDSAPERAGAKGNGELLGAPFLTRLKHDALARLGPRSLLDMALRTGPWGGGLMAWRGLTLARLEREVHGVDLGPLTSCLPERLFNAKKRIALAPRQLVEDVARLEEALGKDGAEASAIEDSGSIGDDSGARAQRRPLLLIGRRELRSNNSWMHNAERLVKGPSRCTLMMHPEDAAARGLADQALVRVESRVGAIVVPLELTAEVMPGVVSLPHGYGHARAGVQLRVARDHAGASHNDLTDPLRVDALCGNAAFSGTPVKVSVL